MSKQDEILGKHPADHPYLGVWLDYEDKEGTDTSCIRVLSEKATFNQQIIDWFANKLLKYHYSPREINSVKTKLEKLGYPKFAVYYEQSRRTPHDTKVQKGNATEVLMTEYVLAAIRKADLIYCHRFRYNTNIDQSMKGDDMLLIDFSNIDEPVFYLGEAKFRKQTDKKVLLEVSQSLSKGKMPLSLSFLRNHFELTDDEKYEMLDDCMTKTLSNYDIRYVGFILSDVKAAQKVEKDWECDNPKHIMLVLSMDKHEEFIAESFEKAEDILKQGKTV